MGASRPWDAMMTMLITLVGVLIFATLGVGWICGIILARRTTLVPRHHQPRWRKLCKLGWTMGLIGWGGIAISYGACFFHRLLSSSRTPQIYFDFITIASVVWFITFIPPILWIVGWLQARRPEKIFPHPNWKKEKQDGTWPPPPSAHRD